MPVLRQGTRDSARAGQKYPDAIRIVHRHFPLDNDCNPAIKKPFHTHACYYARLAACAGSMGKFWPANDHLFKHGRDEAPVALETLARIIEVDAAALRACVSTKAGELLKSDLDEGVRLNLEGTPSFVIDGQVHTVLCRRTFSKSTPYEQVSEPRVRGRIATFRPMLLKVSRRMERRGPFSKTCVVRVGLRRFDGVQGPRSVLDRHVTLARACAK
ncbi:MAG: thioredoxin domain-containing protein [Polyangiaceae bacterium]